MKTFHEGTLELEKQGATLILWPEASWPMDLLYDADRVPDPLVGYDSDLLFGSITRSKHSFRSSEESPFHNTALLSDSQGHILDYYHKMHLVPLGEYVPWKTLFSFAAKLTQHVGELLPGEEARPMRYRDSLLGVLICYEDIFPEIAQQMAAKGAEVLINLTNDAWYGFSSASGLQPISQYRDPTFPAKGHQHGNQLAHRPQRANPLAGATIRAEAFSNGPSVLPGPHALCPPWRLVCPLVLGCVRGIMDRCLRQKNKRSGDTMSKELKNRIDELKEKLQTVRRRL